MARRSDLAGLFCPSKIAVIGVSSRPGKLGHEVMRSLLAFKGEIFAVNPRHEEVLGIKCYSSVMEIKERPELAVIVLPAERVPDALEECGRAGVKFVVIVSSGFKETGHKGEKLENSLVAIAKKYQMRLVGPNCIGVANTEKAMYTFFQPEEFMQRPRPGSVAVMTQSGTIGCVLLEWLATTNIGLSKFISYGNKADIDERDVLEYLLNDEKTDIVVSYVENINGNKLMPTIRKFCRCKYLVMIKGGKTEGGKKAVKSHTGALAGNYAVFEGCIKQQGGIVVASLEEMKAVVSLLHAYKGLLPKFSGDVFIITNGAGLSVLMADHVCAARNLKMGSLPRHAFASLKKKLPKHVILANPLDLTGSALAEEFTAAAEALILHRAAEKKPRPALVLNLVLQDAPLGRGWEPLVRSMSKLKEEAVIVCCADGGKFTTKVLAEFRKSGIPAMRDPGTIITALDKIAEQQRWKQHEAKNNQRV